MDLAIFDLDNTLLAGDSDYQWGEFLIDIGVVDRAAHASINDQFYADYKVGKLDINAFLEFQLKPLSKNPPTPSIAKVSEFDIKTLNPIAGESYQWYLDGVAVNGGILATLKANVPGNYTVQIKDANGCKSPISAVLTILILGTENETLGASVFPNPFNSSVKITFDKEFGESVSVSFYDVKGSLVLSKNSVSENELIDLSGFSDGVYLVKIKTINNLNLKTIKLIKH